MGIVSEMLATGELTFADFDEVDFRPCAYDCGDSDCHRNNPVCEWALMDRIDGNRFALEVERHPTAIEILTNELNDALAKLGFDY